MFFIRAESEILAAAVVCRGIYVGRGAFSHHEKHHLLKLIVIRFHKERLPLVLCGLTRRERHCAAAAAAVESYRPARDPMRFDRFSRFIALFGRSFMGGNSRPFSFRFFFLSCAFLGREL
jgi:hypothetical protein